MTLFHTRLWSQAALALCLALAVWLLLLDPAFAQASGGMGDFSCSNGRMNGTLYNPGQACPDVLKFDNLFSFLVCNMERLSANLMGAMFCGIVDAAVPAVNATLVLAVMIFGMAFTIGVIPATAREFQLFLIKVAFISVFATQADYIIGIGYRFFVEGAREGIVIALSEVFKDEGGAQANGAKIYSYLDSFLGKTLEYATSTVGVDWKDPAKNPCENAVFAVIAAMAIVFPPLFYISVVLITKIGLTFVRAVFGYIYAIMGLSFLLTMAPLFLCFFLFRQTQPLFDKWLGYLVSFTLQMVIVFAFLGAVVSMDIKHIASSVTGIVVANKQIKEGSAVRFPWEYCTICKNFDVINYETRQKIEPDQYKDFLGKGKLVCRDDTPLTPAVASAPKDETGASNDPIRNGLIKFSTTALLSLLVLAYIVDTLLRYAPAMAQLLASGMRGTYAPQLGGGEAFGSRPVVDMPGGKLIDTAERGFTDGYVDAMRDGAATPGAVMTGFKEASLRLVFGGRAGTEGVVHRFSGPETQNDPGLVDSFLGFFVDPNPKTPE